MIMLMMMMIIIVITIIIIIITLKPLVIRPLKLHQEENVQKHGCNSNVNIDVHTRQRGPPKDLPGLKRVKLSVICSLIKIKWVQVSV